VHAVGESTSEPHPAGTYAVVLQAPPEKLLALEKRLQEAGVAFRAIRESDEPWAGELMALGIHPAKKGELKRLLSSLKLLE